MKPSVYLETTIISYLSAWPSRDVHRLSHQMVTREWWTRARDRFDLFVSDFVIDEASAGDATAAAERLKTLAGIAVLPVNDQILNLSKSLATALALPPRARLDAAHVAISAFHGMRFLLTWNCRHLANGALSDKIEETCAKAGFVAPRILTPELLMELP